MTNQLLEHILLPIMLVGKSLSHQKFSEIGFGVSPSSKTSFAKFFDRCDRRIDPSSPIVEPYDWCLIFRSKILPICAKVVVACLVRRLFHLSSISSPAAKNQWMAGIFTIDVSKDDNSKMPSHPSRWWMCLSAANWSSIAGVGLEVFAFSEHSKGSSFERLNEPEVWPIIGQNSINQPSWRFFFLLF